MGIQRPIPNCPYGYDDDGTCGHSENLTPECHLQTCPLYDSHGNLRVSLERRSAESSNLRECLRSIVGELNRRNICIG